MHSWVKSISVLFLIVMFCFFYPVLVSDEMNDFNKNLILLAPSLSHPFGTDILGRDMLVRTALGGQNSLIIGFLASFLGTFIGFVVGISATLWGKWSDKIVIILIDLFLAFPTLFLLFALSSMINASLFVLIIIISLSSWMSVARFIRSESYEFMNQPYMKILHLVPISWWKKMFHYLFPLLFPLLGVNFTLGVSGAILAESGLSFLGLGVMPPDISWGTLLGEGKIVIDVAWWVSFFPGMMLFVLTLSLVHLSTLLQQYFSTKHHAFST